VGQRQWIIPGVGIAKPEGLEHQSRLKHRLCNRALASLPTGSHFLFFIPHSSLFRFHLFLSYPSNFVLFNFQAPSLKLLHQAPFPFSSPPGSVFISSKFIILDILLIAITYSVLYFLTPHHSLFPGLLLSLCHSVPSFT